MIQAPQLATSAGWDAELNLEFIGTSDRTFVRRAHSGPLRIQRPFYPEGDTCHVYMLHPPGGIVGGDTLTVRAQVESNARALVTTPGAAKFYRSSGAAGRQIQQLRVAGGSLEWFPQESIFFAHCNARLETHISITSDSQFIGWDIQCYGRPASKELFTSGAVTSFTQVQIDGAPVFIERCVINDDHPIQRRTGMRGYSTQGLFIATVKDPWLLSAVRDLPSFGEHFFATHVEGLLIVRYLGHSAAAAKSVFIDVWSLLRPVVMGKPASSPRIWAT